MFAEQAGDVLQATQQGRVVHQFAQQAEVVFAACAVQMFLSGLMPGDLVGVLFDRAVVDERFSAEGAAEHEPFERLAAAQCHVNLPVGEGGACIDDGFFEGEPLAFMDGNRPGGFEGILPEGAGHGFGDFPGLLVQGVFDVLPFFASHGNGFPFVAAPHEDVFRAEGGNPSDFAVVVTFFGRGVVFDEIGRASCRERVLPPG